MINPNLFLDNQQIRKPWLIRIFFFFDNQQIPESQLYKVENLMDNEPTYYFPLKY